MSSPLVLNHVSAPMLLTALHYIPARMVCSKSKSLPIPFLSAVHADDPEFRDYEDISQLPKHRLLEIRRFFEVSRWKHQMSLAV